MRFYWTFHLLLWQRSIEKNLNREYDQKELTNNDVQPVSLL